MDSLGADSLLVDRLVLSALPGAEGLIVQLLAWSAVVAISGFALKPFLVTAYGGLVEWTGKRGNLTIGSPMSVAALGSIGLLGYFGVAGLATLGGGGAVGPVSGVVGAPNTPTLTVVPFDTAATLTTSAFIGSGADTHASSDWEITRLGDGSFASPVFQSLSDAANKVSYTKAGAQGAGTDSLKLDSVYIARTLHRGASGGASAWSVYDTFTATSALPDSVPDPAALVTAANQAPDYSSYYATLNVPSQAAGYTYVDSLNNLTVTKVTSGTSPATCSDWGVQYNEGSTRISRAWTRNDSTFWTLFLHCSSAASDYLIDYARATGALSNARAAPISSAQFKFTFAHDIADAQGAYYVSGTTLYHYDTKGDSLFTAAGNFPKAGFNSYSWLQNDATDNIFVGLVNAASDSAVVFNDGTNTISKKRSTGFNEPYLASGGDYILMQIGGSPDNTQRIWDLAADTIATYVQGTGKSLFHGASLYGVFVAEDIASGGGVTPQHNIIGSTGVHSVHYTEAGCYSLTWHPNGGWLQGTVAQGSQFYLNNRGYDSDPGCVTARMLSLVNLDGSTPKGIVFAYADVDNNNSYWGTNWGVQSPDGRVVMWASDMAQTGNRTDMRIFVVQLPIKAAG